MPQSNEYMLKQDDAELIYQKKLTAGTNITIDPITNTISSTGGGGSSVSYAGSLPQGYGDTIGIITIDGTQYPIKIRNLIQGSNINIVQDMATGNLTISSTAQGTHVEANPSDPATARLSTIEIGSIVYDTTYDVFEAPETAQDTGVNGLVPAPTYADVQANKVLQADGTWVPQSGGGGGGTSIILNGQIYSTEEKVVGVWKNNKPLYQKTCVFGSVSGQTANLSLGIANIEEVFLCADASYVNDGDCPLPYVTGTSYANNIGGFFDIGVSDTSFAIRIGQSMAGSVNNVVLTVRYTKTTDTAGSGGYQAYGFTPVIYSTEEREVGVWKDNKPLYQKTIPITKTSTATLVDISSLDIDMLVDCTGVEYPNDKSFFLTLNYHENSNWYCFLEVVGTDLGVYCSGNDYNGAPNVLATIQYTKTTDVAGSGKYNTLGVPNVHYDGNEKVIGTWFGETLYQKTFDLSVSISSTSRAWYTILSASDVQANNMDKIFIDQAASYAIDPDDGTLYPIPYASVMGNSGGLIGWVVTEGAVKICMSSISIGTMIGKMTLRYTKTTD